MYEIYSDYLWTFNFVLKIDNIDSFYMSTVFIFVKQYSMWDIIVDQSRIPTSQHFRVLWEVVSASTLTQLVILYRASSDS